MKDFIDVKMVMNNKSCEILVFGVLDYTTMDIFNKHIQTIKIGTEKVTINFSGLEFIDSTGIGSIINLVHEANSKKFRVEFNGINEEINIIFETIGVFQIMEALQKDGI